ncbi:MAG: pyridoxal 5'-phosphate synthase glutaminase subunit PdxT [Ilumatobacteraceae bacterium]
MEVIGVLALQGAFAAHAESFSRIGCETLEVRSPNDLAAVTALVIPGGESSTMSQLIASANLAAPIEERINRGMPVLGTCAGMILLASEVLDGRDDQTSFGALDVAVRRNAFGRQIDSFETEIDTHEGPFHAVFIRAPRIERVGPDVEVLGRLGDEPVWVRQGNVMAASFHPELTDDTRIHERFAALSGVSCAGTRKDTV